MMHQKNPLFHFQLTGSKNANHEDHEDREDAAAHEWGAGAYPAEIVLLGGLSGLRGSSLGLNDRAEDSSRAESDSHF
jgi:hypothetical protein